MTSDLASTLGLKDVRGALVNNVEQGGPADHAGIQRGDVITALNGEAVEDSNSLRNRVAGTQPGAQVELTFVRSGKEQTAKVTLGELTAPGTRAESSEGNGESSSPGKLGVSVQPLTSDIARQLQLPPTTQGVVITEIDPSGPAGEAGLQQGDVIEEANRQPLRSASDLTAAVDRAGQQPVLLLVNRRGATLFATVRPRS